MDTIPDIPDSTDLPSVPTNGITDAVLDNVSGPFSTSFHRERAEALGELDISPFEEEDNVNYIRDIEVTIAKTWLIVYSAIIRLLNVLVSLSMSYEKHSLPILRAFSIVALVVCCRNACR